jgi:hypothetical protein
MVIARMIAQKASTSDYLKVKAINNTLIVRPPSITLFIWSRANDAASGMSYSTNAKPLCLLATASQDKLTFFIGPNGWNAVLTVSSRTSKLMPPTYTLSQKIQKISR